MGRAIEVVPREYIVRNKLVRRLASDSSPIHQKYFTGGKAKSDYMFIPLNGEAQRRIKRDTISNAPYLQYAPTLLHGGPGIYNAPAYLNTPDNPVPVINERGKLLPLFQGSLRLPLTSP